MFLHVIYLFPVLLNYAVAVQYYEYKDKVAPGVNPQRYQVSGFCHFVYVANLYSSKI